MDRHTIHELAAAYAMNALEDDERKRFEAHLAHCTVCAEELESLRPAAAALAYAIEGPAPPPALRKRLLKAVRSEHPSTVVPFRQRLAAPAFAAMAAAAVCTAVGLGIWAASLHNSLDQARSARQANTRILAVLSNPGSRLVPLAGVNGRLLVSPSGAAVLVLATLPPAPAGKTYEAWVIADRVPHPAGLFAGGQRSVILLAHRVPAGANVAVTLEPGKVATPTGPVVAQTKETV